MMPHTTPSIIDTSSEEICSTICWLNGILNIWFLLSIVLAILSSMMIYSYLHNISLVNECVLLHSIKDIVAISIFIRVVMVIKWMVNFSKLDSIENTTMDPLQAKVVAFVFFSFVLYTLLFSNVISSIRLYIAKTIVLDPPMPWEDDENMMKIIRLLLGGFSVGYPSVLYIFQIYPPMYYDFVFAKFDVPKSSFLFTGILALALIIFVITVMVEEYYKKIAPQKNHTVPKQVNYILLTNVITYGYIIFELTFKLLDSNSRWIVFQILMSIMGLSTPVIAILRSDKLLSYSNRYIRDMYYNAYLYYMYAIPLLLSIFMYLSLYVVYQFLGV